MEDQGLRDLLGMMVYLAYQDRRVGEVTVVETVDQA